MDAAKVPLIFKVLPPDIKRWNACNSLSQGCLKVNIEGQQFESLSNSGLNAFFSKQETLQFNNVVNKGKPIDGLAMNCYAWAYMYLEYELRFMATIEIEKESPETPDVKETKLAIKTINFNIVLNKKSLMENFKAAHFQGKEVLITIDLAQSKENFECEAKIETREVKAKVIEEVIYQFQPCSFHMHGL